MRYFNLAFSVALNRLLCASMFIKIWMLILLIGPLVSTYNRDHVDSFQLDS